MNLARAFGYEACLEAAAEVSGDRFEQQGQLFVQLGDGGYDGAAAWQEEQDEFDFDQSRADVEDKFGNNASDII